MQTIEERANKCSYYGGTLKAAYIKGAKEQKAIDEEKFERELKAYANDIAEDVRKSTIERLNKIAVPSTPDEIASRYWRRFMHRARKCIKQVSAIRDSFADDEEMVNYFMQLMDNRLPDPKNEE